MDVLETKLKERPELESFFNESGKEGFFIKNLENIQGDERDIILISVSYGKDINGKLYKNFGPLNNDGGERRLNVLITRAREKCVVFTNFKSSELDLESTNSRGLEAFKIFLYYAENNEFPSNYLTGDDFDSPFEESVYDFLVDNGYHVEKQVGCAGYKIDLAIVDKGNADNYILGIECDGASYHSSKYARDQDRLRQEILERLGWNFHRILSTDWFHGREKAENKLLDAVEEAMERNINFKTSKEVIDEPEDNLITTSHEDKLEERMNEYIKNYEEYYDPDCDNENFSDHLKKLIDMEGPIHIDVIYQRSKELLWVSRATKKFKLSVRKTLNALIKNQSIYKKDDFYYS